MTKDVHTVYELFQKVGVFHIPDMSSVVKDNTFWEFVIEKQSSKSPPPQWHSNKQNISVSPKEVKTLEFIWDKSELKPKDKPAQQANDYVSADGDDNTVETTGNKSIMTTESIAHVDDLVEEQVRDMSDMMGMLNAHDANLEAANNELSNETVYRASQAIAADEDPEIIEAKKEDMLKKLTNVTKYKLNTDCLSDPFITGRKKLKKVKEERDAEVALFERKVRLLWLSVDYFKKKREKECLSKRSTIIKWC